MNKAEIRSEYKSKRNNLSEAQVKAKDILIFEELKQFDWSGIQYLHCYLAIAKFKEFDTTIFIKWIWTHYPDIKIVISKSDFQTHLLKHYIYGPDTELICNAWGIPEPVAAEEVEARVIDLVLAPLLAVDVLGNRIGYGKGFYDRFFASCKPEVIRTGISYFEPIAEIKDVSTWDVPISTVFTPGKTYFL